MNTLQVELDKLTEGIIRGEVDKIQYLPHLGDASMTSHEYVNIVVRSIFINKVEDRIQKRRRGPNYLIGTLGLSMSLLLFVLISRK